jgi:hypothetical protein
VRHNKGGRKLRNGQRNVKNIVKEQRHEKQKQEMNDKNKGELKVTL